MTVFSLGGAPGFNELLSMLVVRRCDSITKDGSGVVLWACCREAPMPCAIPGSLSVYICQDSNDTPNLANAYRLVVSCHLQNKQFPGAITTCIPRYARSPAVLRAVWAGMQSPSVPPPAPNGAICHITATKKCLPDRMDGLRLLVIEQQPNDAEFPVELVQALILGVPTVWKPGCIRRDEIERHVDRSKARNLSIVNKLPEDLEQLAGPPRGDGTSIVPVPEQRNLGPPMLPSLFPVAHNIAHVVRSTARELEWFACCNGRPMEVPTPAIQRLHPPNVVGACAVLTLPSRLDRRASFAWTWAASDLCRSPLTEVSGVDAREMHIGASWLAAKITTNPWLATKPGAIACFAGHAAIWLAVAQLPTSSPPVLVLEDDIVVPKDATQQLIKQQNSVQKVCDGNEHHIVFLQYELNPNDPLPLIDMGYGLSVNKTSWRAIDKSFFREVRGKGDLWGTAAYSLTVAGARYLLKHKDSFGTLPVDIWLSRLPGLRRLYNTEAQWTVRNPGDSNTFYT